jgi:hypothetical protein
MIISAWRSNTSRSSNETVYSMMRPSDCSNRMATAGMPRPACRILSNARLTIRPYRGPASISRTFPFLSTATPSESGRPDTRHSPSQSQSMQVSAVKVSLTAGERARMAISTSWSMAKTGS